MALVEMVQESVWFEKARFEEDEAHYQLHLAAKNGPIVSNLHMSPWISFKMQFLCIFRSR